MLSQHQAVCANGGVGAVLSRLRCCTSANINGSHRCELSHLEVAIPDSARNESVSQLASWSSSELAVRQYLTPTSVSQPVNQLTSGSPVSVSCIGSDPHYAQIG